MMSLLQYYTGSVSHTPDRMSEWRSPAGGMSLPTLYIFGLMHLDVQASAMWWSTSQRTGCSPLTWRCGRRLLWTRVHSLLQPLRMHGHTPMTADRAVSAVSAAKATRRQRLTWQQAMEWMAGRSIR